MGTITHMTTATATRSPEMRIIASIRGYKAARQISADELCLRLGISRSTWYERMRTGQFTIGEVIALADAFGSSVQALVDGQVTVARIPVYLAASTDKPRESTSNRPLLSVVRPADR